MKDTKLEQAMKNFSSYSNLERASSYAKGKTEDCIKYCENKFDCDYDCIWRDGSMAYWTEFGCWYEDIIIKLYSSEFEVLMRKAIKNI